MTHSSASRNLLGLARSFKHLTIGDPLTQCLAPRLSRGFAAQTQMPVSELVREMESNIESPELKHRSTGSSSHSNITTSASPAQVHVLDQPVLATHYSWPEIEPVRHQFYRSKYLDAPLRKDILHRAVIYEADGSRQGTASTKWRDDVRGSDRKIQKQKGTGRARVRDIGSPIRRGGGVAFGPKPRDFSTKLPSKVYEQAFRIAFSYRLRKNELIILQDQIELPEYNSARFLHNIFEANQWGQGHGRSLLITSTKPRLNPGLLEAMETLGEHGKVKDSQHVDVKDLLMHGRIVIERAALSELL